MKSNQTKMAVAAFAAASIGLSEIKAQSTEQVSSPGQLVDALHSAFGKHPARAVHAKGVILYGTFTPSPMAATLTTAVHLQNTMSNVTVRFSDFTGIPDIPDNAGGANPRGMAIKFTLPDGISTDIVSHSFDGFPTENSDQFRELLLAIAASGPDATKPTVLDNFLGSHPVAKTFLTTQHTPASYGTISYFGVNAFKFTNAANKSCFIRYQFIPVDGEELLTEAQIAAAGNNYLIDEIKQRVEKHVLKFYLFAQIAQTPDNEKDPSVAWPRKRRKVLLGTIEIKSVGSNTAIEDKALTFSPNNIPTGILTADPMLDFRSKAYPISVKERQ